MSRANLPVCLWAGLVLGGASGVSAQTPQGSAFTYQGRLSDNGTAASGPYDLRFALFDAAAGGAQIGATSTLDDVAVNAGLFTVSLDFGSAAFAGDARFLQVAARPGASTGAFTSVGPRQQLTPTPAAVFAAGSSWTGILGKPAGFADDVDDDSGGDITGVIAGTGLTGGATSGDATLAVGFGGSGAATTVSRSDHDHLGQAWSGTQATALSIATSGLTTLQAQTSNATNNARGVFGHALALSGNTSGVHGRSQSSIGRGVFGEATSSSGSALGVLGSTQATAGSGVQGMTVGPTGSANGVTGFTTQNLGAGVFGQGPTGVVARSVSTTGIGLFAEAPATTGITEGVRAEVSSPNGVAVRGAALATTNVPIGVFGTTVSSAGRGVFGSAGGSVPNGVGVYGLVFSTVGWAGWFEGNVHVSGDLLRPGDAIEIDHPLDPENRVLRHASIGSSERKNVYDGVVTTDATGYATVSLPDWFEALNHDFRYQLTIVDEADGAAFVQAKVVKGIAGNRFTLRTSSPATRVCWQVTGVRQDRYAESRPLPVELDKPDSERGTYLQPEAWGLPRARSLAARRWPRDERDAQSVSAGER